MTALYQIDRHMKILVVDDLADMRRSLRKTLLVLGFENVAEAAGGPDAIEKIESGENFDLIISDWNMPQMTGLQFLRYVRSAERCKATPFLMVTAKAHKSNVVEAAKAGVSQYIVKPFTVDALQEKLESMF